jgi:hypothetical protein
MLISGTDGVGLATAEGESEGKRRRRSVPTPTAAPTIQLLESGNVLLEPGAILATTAHAGINDPLFHSNFTFTMFLVQMMTYLTGSSSSTSTCTLG